MYSIGKFSKLTGINIKTLVWYDNIGLLKPEKVNYENGYRYYGRESLKKVANIQFFKSLDFSIDEMINFSNDIIDKKLDELEKKIAYITMNMNLLSCIKEENMKDMSIFEIGEKLVQGKWRYEKTTTDFKKVFDQVECGEKEKSMPDYLFFGEMGVGTDLKDIFGYHHEGLSIKDSKGETKNFWFFVVNSNNTLVLYQKPSENDSKDEKVKFHVYSRLNSQIYSSKEINELYEKYMPESDAKYIGFNKNLVGYWELVDEINESEIAKYNGKIKTKNACHTMSPMFDILEITEDQKVFVMAEDDDITLNFNGDKKEFNRQNTIMTISMDSPRLDLGADGFVIYNQLINKKHKGLYKVFGQRHDKHYLFVNLDNIPDLDETVYVYQEKSRELDVCPPKLDDEQNQQTLGCEFENCENLIEESTKKDNTRNLEQYVEIYVMSEENSDVFQWLKVVSNNIYRRSYEKMANAHYKINTSAIEKVLDFYKEELLRNEAYLAKYALGFDAFEFDKPCLIKFNYDGKKFEYVFDYSNKEILQVATAMLKAFDDLIVLSSIDHED